MIILELRLSFMVPETVGFGEIVGGVTHPTEDGRRR
jgi:hypothetical protein